MPQEPGRRKARNRREEHIAPVGLTRLTRRLLFDVLAIARDALPAAPATSLDVASKMMVEALVAIGHGASIRADRSEDASRRTTTHDKDVARVSATAFQLCGGLWKGPQPAARSASSARRCCAYHRAMELLDIHRMQCGRLRARLAHAGILQELEGTAEEIDELARALAHAAELTSVLTGSCLIADVIVGDKLVRIGLTGAGRVTLVIGPGD